MSVRFDSSNMCSQTQGEASMKSILYDLHHLLIKKHSIGVE